MIVRMDVWDLVRDRFSEAEKAALNAAVICPRSAVLDERALAPELAAKLRGLADLLPRPRVPFDAEEP